MNNWSVLEVCQWLLKEFNDPAIVQEFEDQEIDGEVLVSIDSADKLTKLAPKIKRGKVEKIIIRRDKFLASPQISEARPFKQPSKGISYIQDTRLAVYGKVLEESGPDKDNILVPVREFKAFTNTSSDNAIKKFVFETIRFVTGCLNVRTNGTIYFGIEDKTSKVVGCQLHAPMLDYRDKLEQNIKLCFSYPSMQAAFRLCCSNPKFVDVLTPNRNTTDLFVIEVDVEPKNEDVQKLYFEPLISKSDNDAKKDKQLFVRRGSSSVCLIDEEKKAFVSKEMSKWMKLRRKAEEPETQKFVSKGTCLEKLLLTGSEIFLDNSTFPILVMNKTDNNNENESNFDFIQYIKWRVVIDLDSTGKMLDVYKKSGHNVTQKSVDSFINDLNILTNLRNEPTTCWIFANGNSLTGDEVYDAENWNKWRKGGIWSAVLQLINISINRGLVVFLFDHDTDGILSDLYALFSQFFNEFINIIFIAKHDFSIELLKEKMANDADKIEEMKHGIIGLPWKHVAATFRRVSGEQDIDCELPTSSSTFISVNRKRWPDLSLLGSSECKDSDLSDIDRIRNLQERYNFYCGRQVSWLNFALSDESKIDPVKRHVVKREPIHYDLKQCVDRSFKSTEKIEIAKVYYQPGAGASTVTRHVLWSFKGEYKCAVISKITPTTRDQIVELYQYGEEDVSEENLKPVLVLLDLPNDAQCKGLLEDLRYPRNVNKLYCVIIHCHKVHTDKQYIDHSRDVFLKQSLTDEDKKQFNKILENSEWITKLNADYKVDNHYNPDFMLAFLIFQNNFVSDYTKRCVSQYLNSGELSPWEELIIKYISLLNVYNEEYPEIPTSFFDSLTSENSNSFKKMSIMNPTNWWNSLSASFRILCKEVMPDYRLGTVKSFMIVHPLLAKEILVQVKTKQNQTISAIVSEFLNSNVFKSKQTFARNEVVERTRSMLRKRKHEESGDKKSQKFSPIIEDIVELESPTEALSVLTEAFDILELGEHKDPFLAQQIARLCFIKSKQFDTALKYGREAINLQKNNSYLLDTMGQIYKAQLEHNFGRYERKVGGLSIQKCKNAIELAKNAAHCFKGSIQNNQKETTVNIYGYGGEIGVYRKLLILLQCTDLFSGETGREILYRYLQSDDYIPEQIMSEWNEYHQFLKSLGTNMEIALQETDLMLTMMNPLNNFNESKQDEHKKSYLLKAVLDGGQSFETFLINMPKSTMDGWSQCQLNRLLVKDLGGLKISQILRTEEESLKQMWKLLHFNVNEHHEEFNEFDCKTLLIVSMSMILKGVDSNGRINAAYLLNLCNTIKALSTQPQNRHIANFFLSVLLWPRKDMGIDYNHDSYMTILHEMKNERLRLTKKDQTESSRVAEYQKTGAYSTHFKMATHFWLGNEKGLHSIIQYSDLPDRRYASFSNLGDSEFWNQPNVRHKLLKLTGVIKGNIILAFNDLVKGEQYRIPVRLAISSNNASEEQVNFYLGFSWGGPVAYNVVPTMPNETYRAKLQVSNKNDNGVSRDMSSEEALDWETYSKSIIRLQTRLKNSDKKEQKMIKEEMKQLEAKYKQSQEETELDDFDEF